MDEVIFEEFKGTGNMELVLDRKISDRRIYPAIDVGRSGTRREELLFERRRPIGCSCSGASWRYARGRGHFFLLQRMMRSKTNKEFFATMAEG